MKIQLRAENKSRTVNDVFEQGMVAGKLKAIQALVKSIRETLDE